MYNKKKQNYSWSICTTIRQIEMTLEKTVLDRVQRLALDLDMPMMITGDYNMHPCSLGIGRPAGKPMGRATYRVDGRERFTNDECKGSTHILLKKQ